MVYEAGQGFWLFSGGGKVFRPVYTVHTGCIPAGGFAGDVASEYGGFCDRRVQAAGGYHISVPPRAVAGRMQTVVGSASGEKGAGHPSI